MLIKMAAEDSAEAEVIRRPEAYGGVNIGGVFELECRRPNGELRWRRSGHNLVPNKGLQHLLDVVFSGGTQRTTWYVGLVSDTPTFAAADGSTSHAGWTEFTAYDEAARQEYKEKRTNQTLSNSTDKASFTVSTNGSVIAGAFLISGSTKSGTTGTLIAEVGFTGGDKSADDGDTLSVTYTFTAADDGA